MECLRAENIVDINPLQCALRDDNPSWQMQLRRSRISTSQQPPTKPSDSTSDPAVFSITSTILNKLLIGLNECSEWGRIAILNALARYDAQDDKESHYDPQTQCLMRRSHSRKMAPPLVTLLSSPPKVQWVALRNININLLQKRSDLLSNEMRVFFCKHNDPLYVNVKKLDIMVRLAIDSNVYALLSELKEYSSGVDIDFVRKSIKGGQRFELRAQRNILCGPRSRGCYEDIFGKYPSTYEGIIPTLCADLEELDEPEVKTSLIWIIGEYTDKIDNADHQRVGLCYRVLRSTL
ncbi:hypothetical protein BDR04DRAFT_1112565 [Suillus decipiens]|nr:hypothetical protein BDR04DRAFT_1112565 [Suillus decipiens]